MRLANKVALITDATSGIGRSSAILFAREGATVVVCGRNREKGQETVAEIRQAGGTACFILADVAIAADVTAMIDEAIATYGRLDVLFNNASLLHPEDGSVVDTAEDVWDRVLEVNLKGTFLCCKHALPFLIQSRAGSIINMASFLTVMGSAASQIAYTASKGAILALTRELAVEFAHQNVRANAICPGPIETPPPSPLRHNLDWLARRMVHLPAGQFDQPEEVAQAALFLASDESSYVNGAAFMVEGGMTAAYMTPE